MTETKQSAFWRGSFGDAYIDRNQVTADSLSARQGMWRRILESLEANPPQSILEIGANIGLNLRALGAITDAALYAVEPNRRARAVLIDDGVAPGEHVLDGVAGALPLDDGAVELAFTCGVLIHIHPDDLLAACREVHRVTARYIACVEYFSVRPETITYRGHDDVLFKRDYGAFWLDNFADLELVDYGFLWARATGLDNLTWWLFTKRA